MLDLLPASSTPREVTARSVGTALVIHLLVIAFAVAATRGALEATKPAPRQEPIRLMLPRPEEPSPRSSPPRVEVGPPPEGFQHIPLPLQVPPAVPPIDLSLRPFDPRDFFRALQEPGATEGVTAGDEGSTEAIYSATTGIEGFESAVLVAQPRPQYPPALLSAGVAGTVTLEFVIDTAGRVEAGSVRVVESSHSGFESAARAAVLGARFRPARLRGQPVRQITRQRVRFVAQN